MLQRLYTEHDHIRRTLNLLEIQFIDLCRGQTPDYALMHSIVAYVQEYPEQAHHPLEDAVFSLMLRCGDEPGQMARQLIRDHTELEIVTRDLRLSLEADEDNALFGTDALKSRLADFLQRQRQHLYIEEVSMYPFICSYLSAADWQAIVQDMPPMDAPSFGRRSLGDYEILSREIEARSERN